MEGENIEGWQEEDQDHLGDLAHPSNDLLSASTLVHAMDKSEATPPECGIWNSCSIHLVSIPFKPCQDLGQVHVEPRK